MLADTEATGDLESFISIRNQLEHRALAWCYSKHQGPSSISQRYVTGDHVVLSTRVAGPSGIGDLEAEQTQAVRVDGQVDSDIGHTPWLPSSLALTSKASEM